MEAGTEAGLRSMSPLRVAQAIGALGGGLSGTGSVDNAVLRADGTGGETLQASDISVEDATTSTQANVAITNQHAGQTNSALVLTPKGTGALILGPKPDGTATGGNARGAKAVDLQVERASAAKVASGDLSFAVGGENTASGGNAFVGGYNNVVSGLRATALGTKNIASGESSTALGEGSTASGLFSVAMGKATSAIRCMVATGGLEYTGAMLSQLQTVQLVQRTTSTDPTTLTTYGVRPTITAGTTQLITIMLVGTQADGSSGGGIYRAMIKRVGTATSLVGTVAEVVAWSGDAGLGSPTITISADDTNEALSVVVTAANTTATKWAAGVMALQVNH
jgi:hypothetical protein